MGKTKGPSLPQTPQYIEDPNLSPNITFGSDITKQLLSGDFSGNLSWLRPTIDSNNTALALAAAQGTLQPQFRDNLQSIRNEAAAAGQLESSTFTDALARSQSDLNSKYQSIVAQQAIRDAEMSNQNRLGLFGTGLQGLQGFTGLAQNKTNAQNQFNLENYNNQVASVLAGQKQANGGLLGGLMGAGGGAALGLALAPFTGGSSLLLAGGGALLGGAAGALTPQSQNVGGSLLGSGAGLLGGSLQAQQLGNISGLLRTGQSAPGAGAFASNDLGVSQSPFNYGLRGLIG